ncbi:MAG: hypothetical protein NTX00_04490 [Candidatus Parcubacteria bacterium]|nr:hypothetical protein [Candidatus Parcubacteria bacterium]
MKDRQEDLSEQANQKFARQLKEIISQYLAGDLTDDHLQALIEHRNSFKEIEYPELDFAIKVLGENKVISSNEAANAWKLSPGSKIWSVEVLENLVKIRYSKATLRKAAKENKKGLADWRLVYINGLSLREQREKSGTDRSKQPYFRISHTWWLESKHDIFATFKPKAGYYLINFRAQFGNMKWDQQKQEVAKLGIEYGYCHEAIFIEAILTIYNTNNGVRIAEEWSHQGGTLTDNGEQLIVGWFTETGVGVHSYGVDEKDPDMRVVVARKWDF